MAEGVDRDRALDVLRRAVLKEKSTNMELNRVLQTTKEELRIASQRAAELEAQLRQTTGVDQEWQRRLRAAVDEAEARKQEVSALEGHNAQLTQRVQMLQDDLRKAKSTSAGGMLRNLGGLVAGGGGGKMSQADYDVVVEELEHKIRDVSALQEQIFDLKEQHRAELDALRKGRQREAQMSAEDATRSAEALSAVEEDLRVSKAEEERLQELHRHRTAELGEAQAAVQRMTTRVRELEARLAAAANVARKSCLLDPDRNKALAALTLRHSDAAMASDSAALARQAAAHARAASRDVESLLSNTMERLHILVGRSEYGSAAAAGTSQLRSGLDTLKKANVRYKAAAAALTAAADAAADRKMSHAQRLAESEPGDLEAAVDPAPAAVGWLQCVTVVLPTVVRAVFKHSPTQGTEVDANALSEPLVAGVSGLASAAESGGDTAPSLRQLHAALKAVAEAAATLFAQEVKVSWELAGFDGVNKRLGQALNSLLNTVGTSVDLRGAIAALARRREELPAPAFGLMPPEDLMLPSERESLPRCWLSAGPPLRDNASFQLRASRRTRRWLRGAAAAAGNLCSPPDGATPSGAAAPADAPTTSPQRTHSPTADVTASATTQLGDCHLLTAVEPSGDIALPTDDEAMLSALVTADAKAVEWRLEWQRAILDLESKASLVATLEDRNRELSRHMRERENEIMNVSRGYSEQMRMLQDRIVDLQNQLTSARASAPARGRR